MKLLCSSTWLSLISFCLFVVVVAHHMLQEGSAVLIALAFVWNIEKEALWECVCVWVCEWCYACRVLINAPGREDAGIAAASRIGNGTVTLNTNTHLLCFSHTLSKQTHISDLSKYVSKDTGTHKHINTEEQGAMLVWFQVFESNSTSLCWQSSVFQISPVLSVMTMTPKPRCICNVKKNNNKKNKK